MPQVKYSAWSPERCTESQPGLEEVYAKLLIKSHGKNAPESHCLDSLGKERPNTFRGNSDLRASLKPSELGKHQPTQTLVVGFPG